MCHSYMRVAITCGEVVVVYGDGVDAVVCIPMIREVGGRVATCMPGDGIVVAVVVGRPGVAVVTDIGSVAFVVTTIALC